MPLLYHHITDLLIAADEIQALVSPFKKETAIDWAALAKDEKAGPALDVLLRDLFDVCHQIKNTEVAPSAKSIMQDLIERPAGDAAGEAGDDPLALAGGEGLEGDIFEDDDEEISNLLGK